MNPSPEPLVSIVTPVHNEAEFLAECIESVLAQTYQNWEYTIVDNCSTDRSVDIARQYAAKDRRIRVSVNTQFLRAIQNFNRALRQISPASKYCKIVLGDDWIFPECLERMVALGESHPSVGIVGAYALAGRQIELAGLPYPSDVVDGREICRKHLLEKLYVFGTQNSVLYRADLVRKNDPFYNEANIHADTEACFALLRTWDFGFIHQVLTYTRVRAGSLNSIATSLQTNLPAILHLLQTYGSDYLTPEELDVSLRQHISVYYRFLGKSLVLSRDKKFWDYHKKKLAECGIGFSPMRLARGAFEAFWTATLNPLQSIAKGVRVLRLRSKLLRH